MTTIITHAEGTIYASLMGGWESERESGNIAHPISGRANPDYTLRPAQLRTGTLTFVFFDSPGTVEYVLDGEGYVVPVGIPEIVAETASLEAEEAHALAQPFTLSEAERSSVLMTYVVRDGGRVRRSLDPETRAVWLLTVDFQEIVE